jgi:hypothetical protein
LFHSHNFGHNGPAFSWFRYGKNVRIAGGMGLAILPYMDKILEEKK